MTTHYTTPAERWSHSAWSRLELTPPCDLRKVCEFLGFELRRDALPPGFLGLFTRDAQGAIVTVSESLKFNEQRFICAHEIIHGLSVRRLPGHHTFTCSAYNRNDEAEREADAGARRLLCPTATVITAAGELGVNPGKLAHHFGVDIETMRTRLYECGLMPDWRRR